MVYNNENRSGSNGISCRFREGHQITSDSLCVTFCVCSLLYIQHPFVWSAHDTVQDFSGEQFAILPYPLGGSLHSFIFRCRQRREYLSEAQAFTFFCQAVAAVDALHTRGVCHGNISSKQLLFVDQARDRLALSVLEAKPQFSAYYVVTAHEGIAARVNASPDRPVDQRAAVVGDIRALGRLLYELCCLEPPQNKCCTDRRWHCPSGEQMNGGILWNQTNKCSVFRGAARWKQEGLSYQQLYPPISQRYRPEVAELVHLLLLGEESLLPTTASILKLPFLVVSSKAVATQQYMFPQRQDGISGVVADSASPSPRQHSKEAVPSVLTVPHFPSVPIKEEATPRSGVTASSAILIKKQEEGTQNSQPSSVALDLSETRQCCGQVAEGEVKSPAKKLACGEQQNAVLVEKGPPTSEDSKELQKHTPRTEDRSISYRMQKEPQYIASSDDVPAGSTAMEMDEQLRLRKTEPLCGEAAVRAVLAARKLRRKQQNAEKENQLSKIRIDYAKQRKTVEETVRNRLLQESTLEMPMHISEEGKKPKTMAAALASDEACTCCCLSPRSCFCGPALRSPPQTEGIDAAAAAASAAAEYNATSLSDAAWACTPVEQRRSLNESHTSHLGRQPALVRPVEFSAEAAHKLMSGTEASQSSQFQLMHNVIENGQSADRGFTAYPNTGGSVEENQACKADLAATRCANSGRLALATDGLPRKGWVFEGEENSCAPKAATKYPVVKCIAADDAVKQQQKKFLPCAFLESRESQSGGSLVGSTNVNSPDTEAPSNYPGHCMPRRPLQQPTLNVLVGLRKNDTWFSCIEEPQLLPVAYFALSSTGCSK